VKSVESQPKFQRNMSPPSSELCLPPTFTLVSCLAYSSTLKMEAICSSETSNDFQRTTRRYILERKLERARTISNSPCRWPIRDSNRILVRSVTFHLNLFSPARKCRWVILYTRPTVDLRQGWPVFYFGFPGRNLAITCPHHCIWKPELTAGISWAGQVKYIFHCHSSDFSSRFLYRHFPHIWRSVLAICSSARRNVIEQCCPTFLYIGAHLTDGCGGVGAAWRLQ
jgi:hypothetical protein